jgi:thioredoxin-dependent peroxiredoxin
MESGPTEGDPAPPFDLAADDGGRVSLEGCRGRALALFFYPKVDTSGCTREAQAFSALKKQFEDAGAAVIGVSADSVPAQAAFRKKHGLSIALGSDASRRTVEDYGVWVEKSMYGRTYMGIERATFLIDRAGRIARVWRKVKVPGHAEEVLAAAKAMPDGKAVE